MPTRVSAEFRRRVRDADSAGQESVSGDPPAAGEYPAHGTAGPQTPIKPNLGSPCGTMTSQNARAIPQQLTLPSFLAVEVTGSGKATAGDGGLAISGVHDATGFSEVRVNESGAATAIGPGAIAVSGVLSVTVQQPLPPTVYQLHSTLPADVAAFTGRDEHVDAIGGFIGQADSGDGVSAVQGGVLAIDGMPGVGKTALAVHLAHQLKERFSDRQLFLDLHGHTPGIATMTPFDALGVLLTAFGMDARYLPTTLAERIGHWRDRVSGQRALLVLDNAADSEQVVPLLPGDPGSLVLITSRRYLGDLDFRAKQITLDPLTESEALALFRRLAPRASSDSDTAVCEVAVQLAARLPLALTLLARVYANHPTWTLQVLIDKTRDRMMDVRAENKTIAAAFGMSYAHLVPAQQQLFTLLGLHPGTEFDNHAAAALAGINLGEATDLLEDLYSARLVTEPSAAHPGRFGMHDLIRTYVRGKATLLPGADRERAVERLLDYYQHTAIRANTFLSRYRRPDPVSQGVVDLKLGPVLSDQHEALAWVRTERKNLLACLDFVASSHLHPRVVTLTAGLEGLLRRDGPWTEAATRHSTATDAARQGHDNLGEAGALIDLGVARWLMDDYTTATRLLSQALSLYRAIRNPQGEANALTELGVVLWMTGDYPLALQHLEKALALFEEVEDRLGLASARNSIGVVCQLTGDYPRAERELVKALAFYGIAGDSLGAAHVLTNLGVVSRLKGEYEDAAQFLNDAMTLYMKIGNLLGKGNCLKELGIVNRLRGHYSIAITQLEEALSCQLQSGNRLGQANSLKNLGATQHLAGNIEAATTALEKAFSLYQRIEDRLGQADTTKFLGSLRLAAMELPEAERDLSQALTICRELGDQSGEVEVLNHLGDLYRLLDNTELAASFHRQSMRLSREIGSPRDEAIAITGTARCALIRGQQSDARTLLTEALEIFQRINAVEAADVAQQLEWLADEETHEETGSAL